jgi:protein-ribulosamine 3-kinase
MNYRDQKNFYETIIGRTLSCPVKVTRYSPIGGGCIHQAVKVETSGHGPFFVKSNDAGDADMFEKEYLGLFKLRAAGTLYVPEPLGYGQDDHRSYIITEFIESGRRKPDFWEKFGNGLADLHRQHADRYGFEHDNYIGRLPQRNDYSGNWIDFFIGMRLEVQLKMAVDMHRVDQAFSRRFGDFMTLLPDMLPEEPPSLLHGDLWSGNFMTGSGGYAVMIDPAVYYGNREIELSFTRMFGGFDDTFYHFYHRAYPLAPGFEERVDIYNLYPTLVHVNLFGSTYLGGLERVLRRFT